MSSFGVVSKERVHDGLKGLLKGGVAPRHAPRMLGALGVGVHTTCLAPGAPGDQLARGQLATAAQHCRRVLLPQEKIKTQDSKDGFTERASLSHHHHIK